MKVVGVGKLKTFAGKHADVEPSIRAWLYETKEANWSAPADIKETYSSVSILGDKIVVFNLKGNKYRLAVRIAYNTKTVSILKIGTHSEYSKWKF